MKSLSDKMHETLGVDCLMAKDVKIALKNLKLKGLERTLYPKYLMITCNDMKEIFGDALLGDKE